AFVWLKKIITKNKCLGVQGKSVGSEISLYDCDETNELQKWECKNETLLALKGQELYIELTADNTAVLSKTVGPNNHLTISGTSSGACTRTYRELFTTGGNAAGLPCMFPFLYKDQWYSNCTTFDSSEKRLWCAVETKFQNERWGYCPTTSRDEWNKHPITGTYYQLNTQSAVTWSQAEVSCKQQGASLLSITDPHEQAYIIALLANGGNKLWTGLIVDPDHGWKWTNGRPYRYMKWDSGHPLPNPGYNCAILDPAVQYSWQSSLCSKKLGYICYSKGAEETPTQAVETSFCSRPWIPYNGHCFHINRTQKTWSEAQRQCRSEGGDLVSIRNVEDQSFIISQLGYASTDELWIGLNDKKTEGLFDWSDSSTVSFTSWEYGKPGVGTDVKDCILIRGEVKAMTMGWRRHGSYCYFIGRETKTFDDAKDACKSSGSYLADVSTGVDNAFLVSLVGMRSEKYFWLGLSNQKKIDEFVWTNTDSVRFTHWNAEMPGRQQGCVAIKTGIYAGLWDVLPCTNKEKYICKHVADGATPTSAPPTINPPKCAEGWTKLVSRNYCFMVFSRNSQKKRTWFEARDFCMAIGGDLLSIHSPADQQYETVWIGLSAPDPAAGYVWSDKSPLHFQHWQSDEPNNKNKVESCAELQISRVDSSGSWNDVHCETYRGWICQIHAGKISNLISFPQTQTSDGWLEWNGTQYYIGSRSMAMEDARHFCQQRHGDLVTINSEAESIFLWKQISQSYGSYWIGLTVDLDATYGWMDGSPVVFQRWDENQPNFLNNDENCAVMTASMGFWHDYNCGYEHNFICKRSGSPPDNTTVAPTVVPKGSCPLTWKKFNSKKQKMTLETRKLFLSMEMAKAPTTDLWIGLHNIRGYQFYWTDGRPNRYNNWGSDVSGYIVVSLNQSHVCARVICWPSAPESPKPTIASDYVTIFNDSIKAFTLQMNWDAARKHCENNGANLASIRNEWSQLYLELIALKRQTPLWIGLNKNQTGGYFRYTDGWPLRKTNWGTLEPGTQPCVYVDVDGKWKTANCRENKTIVCMKSTEVAPTESSNYPGICPDDPDTPRYRRQTWLPFKGNCYLFLTDRITWPHASTSCVQHGATLVSIEDPSEQSFIEINLKTYQDSHSFFWIGLYKTHKGLWQWLDKTVMGYNNWDADQRYSSDYGAIRVSDGTWKTGHRWQDSAYICKTPKGETIIFIRTNIRIHTVLVAVLVIIAIVIAGIIIFILFKRSGRRLPIPEKFTAFDNPLFFSNDRAQSGLVDTEKLVANAAAENSGSVIIV
uniref:Mannose receptor, C type 1b n=1 Tax=Anabas testudineus TaxID=64144 RepID=A0A7N6ADX3_ANATE